MGKKTIHRCPFAVLTQQVLCIRMVQANQDFLHEAKLAACTG